MKEERDGEADNPGPPEQDDEVQHLLKRRKMKQQQRQQEMAEIPQNDHLPGWVRSEVDRISDEVQKRLDKKEGSTPDIAVDSEPSDCPFTEESKGSKPNYQPCSKRRRKHKEAQIVGR